MKTIALRVLLISITSIAIGAGAWESIPMTTVQESPFGSHYWVVASSTIQPALDVDMDGKPDTDLLILIPPCERDDADRYLDDGTILTSRGSASCEADEEEEEETGTWSYDPTTKTLLFEKYDGGKPVEARLASASASQIVLITNHQSSKGTHTIRTTLKSKKI
ncbi:hypothetical protein ACFOET_00245 [Parapedobacter deserti]|uniref:Lipocalin-like domain-containing protein n=1 Tax=Parapedobacter deserti TaxID=1912957 RepID=A0ABV7JIE4_9SPHI